MRVWGSLDEFLCMCVRVLGDFRRDDGAIIFCKFLTLLPICDSYVSDKGDTLINKLHGECVFYVAK